MERYLYYCILIPFIFFSFDLSARNHVVTIRGGDVHIRGILAEGGCEVSSESEDMHVNMGQYTTSMFKGTGSESTLHIPFSIHLTNCNPVVANNAKVSFYGVSDPKDPNAFLVSSMEDVPFGISGKDGFTGLGLIIFDENGQSVVPNMQPELNHKIEGKDVIFPFTAHYRATSQMTYPSSLHSDVWFRVTYS
jgi:type 1 fimbria pilin